MTRLLPIVGCSILLSGCASTTGAFFNRPVVEDQVGDVLHTVSLSADRRTVIVARRDLPTPRFCAEPPPDTATSLKTDLDASGQAKGVTLGVKDKFETSVTVLSARNAPLDAFRTGMFALCQFYLNGAIKEDQVAGLFRELLTTFKETQNLVNESTVTATKPPIPAADAAGAKAQAEASDKPESTTVLTTKKAK